MENKIWKQWPTEVLTVDKLIEYLNEFKELYGGDRFINGVSLKFDASTNSFTFGGMKTLNHVAVARSASANPKEQVMFSISYEPEKKK